MNTHAASMKDPSVYQERHLALGAIGFTQRTHSMLEKVLGCYRRPGVSFGFKPPDQADILLVNGDLPDSVATLQRLHAQRPRPTVIVGMRRGDTFPDACYLPSSLSSQAFMQTLWNLADQLQAVPRPAADAGKRPGAEQAMPPAPVLVPKNESRNAASATGQVKSHVPAREDEPKGNVTHAAEQIEADLGKLDNRGGYFRNIDFHDQAQLNKLYFNPENFLSQHLRAAVRKLPDKAAILEVNIAGRVLILDFKRNRWSGSLDEHALRALCLEPLHAAPQLRLLPEPPQNRSAAGGGSDDAPKEARSDRAEFILAQIGLWCSRGHLPRDVDPFAPIRLRHWPNLPHLPRTYGAMRLAALWTQRPCSLAEAAERTGILQRHVVAFYVLCDMLDLLDVSPVRSSAPNASQPARAPDVRPPGDEQRGFLRKLMQFVGAVRH